MPSLALLSAFLFAVAVAAPLHAAELTPLSSVELHDLCLAYSEAPEGDEAQACAAYVRGFIEGSERVVLRKQNRAETRAESFSERAWRTRLGTRQPPEPKYCVAETLSMKTFITQLLTQAERTPPTHDMSAQELLYATLTRFYRCSR
jgi:hypothetical protein